MRVFITGASGHIASSPWGPAFRRGLISGIRASRQARWVPGAKTRTFTQAPWGHN